ncbi:MAG: YihY family inner membrane protein [Alphaproteobacteria bacterium]|nr:MAG: YihY family inner membrane protein [Alphaproteobacteria bacterium]
MFQKIFTILPTLRDRLWRDDPESLPRPIGIGLQMLRVTVLLLQDFLNPKIRLRAMGLVYLTLISIVPLLAISFSLLKAFGVHNQFRDVLMHAVEPLGAQGGEVVDQILTFVDSMKMEGLGVVGVGILLFAVVSALQMVETALNEIWRVDEARRLVQRISTYVVVMIFGPLLGFSAMALLTGISSSAILTRISAFPYVGHLIEATGQLFPFLIAACGFLFLFTFMPNTRVKLRPAFRAALIATFFWFVIGLVFSVLVVSSGRYAVIYSAFASLVLFMLWLFMSWMVVLIGARGAYLLQYPDYIVEKPIDLELSIEQQERLALRVLQLVGHHFYKSRRPWTQETLSADLKVPWLSLEETLSVLVKGGYLETTGADPHGFVPGKPFEDVTLATVLQYIRRNTAGRQSSGFKGDRSPMLNAIVGNLTKASDHILETTTLKDLALESQD